MFHQGSLNLGRLQHVVHDALRFYWDVRIKKVLIFLFPCHGNYVASQLGCGSSPHQYCSRFQFDYRLKELLLHKHHFDVLIHAMHQA